MTARPIEPPELIDLAGRLVGRGAGPGRPRTIELRRGVSTAYYAVFHDLSWRATAALLGEGGWTPRAAAVSRWVSHTDVRRVADVVTGAKSNSALALALGTPAASLVRVSDAFATLQDARHEADYEDFYDLNRALALSLVETAEEAVELTRAMDEAEDPSYGVFCRLLLGAAQAKARR